MPTYEHFLNFTNIGKEKTMKNTTIDMVFRFKVKEGKEDRYEKVIKKQLAITATKDPGVLIYNIFKEEPNSYCQHERYENEGAINIHLQNTAKEMAEWYEITEVFQIIVLGDVSEEFLKTIKGLNSSVYKPYKKVNRASA